MIVLAGSCTYRNSLTGPFIWDDQETIVTNGSIRHAWPIWPLLSPPQDTSVAGRPLVNLSFAVNYAAGGLNVTGYHVVNIAVHIAAALLLFGIVRHTLSMGRMFATQPRAPNVIALASALLWMLHPIQSEAVDYLSQRSEALLGLLFFLALYGSIRALRARAHRRLWEGVAIGASALGMATKETMVILPVVVVVYDFVFEFDSIGDAFRSRKVLYVGLASSWLVLVALMAGHPRSVTAGFANGVSTWTYLLNQAQMIVQYLRLVIWPRALVLDYGLPRGLSLNDVLPGGLLVFALVMASLIVFVQRPTAGFLGVVFFLALAPASSFVPIATEVGAERRMYLPLAALSVMAVMAAWHVIDRIVTRYSKKRTVAFVIASALVTLVLVTLSDRTLARNAEYASPLTLWRTSVDRWPQGRAHYGVAVELVRAERHEEALPELEMAVQDFSEAGYLLGGELARRGRLDAAVTALGTFLRWEPPRPERAELLLGQILTSQGRLDDATTQFRRVLKVEPSNKDALEGVAKLGAIHATHAATLMSEHDLQQAAVEAHEAVNLAPLDPGIHNLLGVALASQKQFGEAISQFREALRINPAYQDARVNLEHALSESTGSGQR